MHPVEVLLLPVGWALRNRRPDEAASIANAPELASGNRIALTSHRPLPGHGAHRYRFHLYALDTDVDFTKVGDIEHLPSALAGHVLASGTRTS